MESEIIILNTLTDYIKEQGKEDKPYTRIEFVFKDYDNTPKKHGTEVLTTYIMNNKAFNLIPEQLILKVVKAEFEIVKDRKNPLIQKMKLVSVNGTSLI